MARETTLSLPPSIADELTKASARAERSVGFLVLGALKASGPLTDAPPTGERASLPLTMDDDDPRDLPSRLTKLASEKAPGRSLDDAIALAWMSRRTQILAWVDRVAEVNEGERADDLDEGLRIAQDPKTLPARLIELAKSEYPRVRALVAAHPAAPAEALKLLGTDRERIVREALLEHR